MTSRNKPKVSIVIGIVRMISMGFKKLLSKAKTAATIIAVIKSSIETPGNKYAVSKTAIALARSLAIHFILFVFNEELNLGF
jgi:hypothetical protein